MFKKLIWIKIESSNYYNLLVRLNDIGICIIDSKKEKNYLLLKINVDDYIKIRKNLKKYNTSIYSKTGIFKLIDIFNKYIVFIISIIISVFMLLFINNLVLKIDIKSNNKEIKSLLSNELEKHNLGILKLKKDHQKIENIVNDILDSNKEILEWLEIKYDGLIMIVNVVPKTNNKRKEEIANCDIVAKTDAKIISMNLIKGVPLKEINDYVSKDDVIISGSIIYNEEVKGTVCSDAKIFGEVWYKVHVEMPLKEEKKKYTGKNRYNICINYKDNNYDIFKSRINGLKDKKIKNLYTLNSFKLNLVKEKEYVINSYNLEENEAYNKAIRRALEKIKLTLKEDEVILLQKVLKKSVNNSTIILDIFVVTKEDIGIVREIESGDNGGESTS